MKAKVWFVVALSLILVAQPAGGQVVGEFQDGFEDGFEQEPADSGIPDKWKDNGASGGAAVVNDTAYEGDHSARVNDNDVNQNFGILPEEQYYSVFVEGDIEVALREGTSFAELAINGMDANIVLDGDLSVGGTDVGNPNNEWVFVRMSGIGDGDPQDNVTVYWEDQSGNSNTQVVSNADPNGGYLGVRFETNNGNAYVDSVKTGPWNQSVVYGTVTGCPVDNPGCSDPPRMENADINLYQNGNEVANTTTDSNGYYQFITDGGDYLVEASKDGYISENETVSLSESSEQINFELEAKGNLLNLDIRPWMEHGTRQPYQVVYTQIEGNDRTRVDVTNESAVKSSNTSVISVVESSNELAATNDLGINKEVTITANYTTDENEVITVRKNVTVANLEVGNVDILPFWRNVQSAFQDYNVLTILAGTVIGALGAVIASASAGLAALALVCVAGWFAGYATLQTAMLSVLIALFIGMNLSLNVDRSIR